MKYPEILLAKFLERPNRFIARVDAGNGDRNCPCEEHGAV